MKVYFYRAECGDAARVHYRGSDGQYHNIFIDSGYERTYDLVLRQEIEKIRERGELIDLWVISHIHDDHIGGVIAYLQDIHAGRSNDIVDQWFYNPPRTAAGKGNSRRHSATAAFRSIKQGDQLSDYLTGKDRIGHLEITDRHPVRDLFGMKLYVLTPQRAQLQKLRDKYAPGKQRALEKMEAEPPEAARQFDYHIPLERFNLKKWEEDLSVENGSSISVLMDYGGNKILWLSDAFPGSIIKGLKKLGYSKTNPLVCDWVKVTHHGSKGNNSTALYSMIRCNNYLISADGLNSHCLPTKECLARILCNPARPPGSKYLIRFTYNNRILRKMFDVDGADVYHRYQFEVSFSSRKWIRV